MAGRGGRFFTHLAWSGTLRAGGQAELKAAGRTARPPLARVMAPRSPSPCKDTGQRTTHRSRPAHGQENHAPERRARMVSRETRRNGRSRTYQQASSHDRRR